MASAADEAPALLAPSEYEAEAGTAVGGRVALSRLFKVKTKGKAQKGKGKCKEQQEADVCELHVLGGKTTSDVLFLDAWGEDARTLHGAAPLGSLKMFRGLKIIHQKPEYSTSQLSYHAKVVPALGRNTLVMDLPADADESWGRIPMEHPVLDLESIKKVTDKIQVCAKVVVESNPGVVERKTRFGDSRVCNAVVRMQNLSIRTSFWRELADNMAQHGAGTPLFMTQVVVVKTDVNSWELRGSNATQLTRLSGAEGDAMQAATDMSTESVRLTSHAQVDYDRLTTTNVATVASIFSVLVPDQMRNLAGVYDLHHVTVTGVTSVLSHGGTVMVCCAQCKKGLEELEEQACSAHPEAGTESRRIVALHIADHSGNGEAMMYHETAEYMTKHWNDDLAKLNKTLKSVPWSLRVVYRQYNKRNENYVEIKRMAPSLDDTGILNNSLTTAVPPTLVVSASAAATATGVRFAPCKLLARDDALGLLTCKDKAIQSARIIIRLVEISENEQNDAFGMGAGGAVRVSRKCRCVVDPEDNAEYVLQHAGTANTVRWLLMGKADQIFMVLVNKKAEGGPFVPYAFCDVSKCGLPTLRQYAETVLKWQEGAHAPLEATFTPQKRLKVLVDDGSSRATTEPFATRGSA